jgi:hypothetical protein
METAVVSGIYYEWTDANAFSWTLYNIATYYKHVKFLMLLVKSKYNFLRRY